MSRWRRVLLKMAQSQRGVGFTYNDAAAVLRGLDFEQKCEGSSHRRWVRLREGEPAVIIGLVEKGHGELKPVYIKTLVERLRDAGLIPED